jgi:hypothetical protein
MLRSHQPCLFILHSITSSFLCTHDRVRYFSIEEEEEARSENFLGEKPKLPNIDLSLFLGNIEQGQEGTTESLFHESIGCP